MKIFLRTLQVSFITVFLLALNSCKDTLPTQEIIPETTKKAPAQLDIRQAEKWFSETIREQEARSRTSREGAKKRTALWEKAYKFPFEFGEGIVVPIQYEENLTPFFDLNQKVKQKQGKGLTSNDLDALVIYQDSKGVMKYEVLNVVADFNYLKRSQNRKKVLPFEGIINVTDWFDNLQYGYTYNRGEPVRQVISSRNARVSSDVTVECVTIDWYSCPGGTTAPSSGCTYLYSQTNCTVSASYSSGGVLSGGSGSYSGHANAYSMWASMGGSGSGGYGPGSGNIVGGTPLGGQLIFDDPEMDFWFWTKLNETEREWCRNNREKIPRFYLNSIMAESISRTMYGCLSPFRPDVDGTNQNAFKHAYWSALNAKAWGIPTAQTIANNHEVGLSGLDTEMDNHNNALGIIIGASFSSCMHGCDILIEVAVQNAINSGQGRRVRNGARTEFGQLIPTTNASNCQ